MPVILDVNDVRKQLSKLLDRVRAGEEIIIAVDGKPCARLVPPDLAPVIERQDGGGLTS